MSYGIIISEKFEFYLLLIIWYKNSHDVPGKWKYLSWESTFFILVIESLRSYAPALVCFNLCSKIKKNYITVSSPTTKP